MKTALIDADSIIHIIAYHNAVETAMVDMFEDATEEQRAEVIQEMYEAKDNQPVYDHIDSFIRDILNATEADHYLGFLGARTGSDTFRHKLAKTKPYKGQRGKTPHWTAYWKPIMIEYMVKEWGFIELFNIEADDALGICGSHIPGCVLCSPDKDLKQIAGAHYDYKKQEHAYVTVADSYKLLYSQVLVGDSVDNISGCPGVGKKSPFLEFEGCITPEDYHKFTYEVFKVKKKEDMMGEQLALVYMLRELDGVDLKEMPKPIPYVAPPKAEEVIQEPTVPKMEFKAPDFTQ